MNELIRQARELCEKHLINHENGADAFNSYVPQLCNTLEAAQKEIADLKEYEECYQDICEKHQDTYRIMDARVRELTARAEKAEAERDTYKKALSHLEHMVSGERSGNRKREHSIGVMAALCKARELLNGVPL